MCGEYAYEENIDDDHRFIETKHFMVAGVPKCHVSGQKTMLTYSLIELRKKNPELFAQWHEVMIIMQQPSGFVDKVIMKWHLEFQRKRYPCSLVQRDLLA